METQAENLRCATEEALETLCFAVAGPASPEPQAGEVESFALTFSGEREGELVLVLERELAVMLTQQMLASEEASAAERADALGELANVICGQYLREQFQQLAFTLHPPRASDAGALARCQTRVELSVEGGWMAAGLRLQEGARG